MGNGTPNLAALERIKNARANSLKIMRMDSSGKLDEMARNRRDSINDSLEGSSQPLNEMRSSVPTQRRAMSPSASKVPQAIMESFKANPLDQGSDMNILDDVFRDEITESRQQIRESAPSQHVQIPTGQGIDYPTIRAIVEEIVRKYTGSLQKKMLTENKQQLNELGSIVIGKSFKFLDKAGNIYEAKLTKVGNINDK